MASSGGFTDCPILHEDGVLLIVDKPSGVLSHPNRPGGAEVCAFPGSYDASERKFMTPAGPLWLIHRLDEDTSGVLLAAKTATAAELCRLAFEEDRVRKRYWALVSGTNLPAKGAWLDHLSTSHGKGSARTRVVPSARPNAELHFTTEAKSSQHRATLLNIDLLTGKTHQIRVQAASRRCAVLGDDVYGDFGLNRALRKSVGLDRLFLHAHQLEMIHPVTKKRLKIDSALPASLTAVLQAMAMKK